MLYACHFRMHLQHNIVPDHTQSFHNYCEIRIDEILKRGALCSWERSWQRAGVGASG